MLGLWMWFLLASLCITIAASRKRSSTASDKYFAMCLIVKDESEEVAEWIEYHKRMGASKFYIFVHNSTAPVLPAIKAYVETGLVYHRNFRTFDASDPPQVQTYDECLRRYGSKHNFMAFIDVDEFIVVVDKTKKIPDVLRNYEGTGGLSLNWMLFGSSGHAVKPAGGVIANYHKCYKNRHVKAIVNTKYCLRSSGNPHYFVYKPNYFSVSTNFSRVVGPFNDGIDNAFKTMYINHYNSKSMEEFVRKVQRGRGAMANPHKYSARYFHELDSRCVDDCPVLQMPPAGP